MELEKARDFLKNNHWGVLATRRKNGQPQMSPVTVGLSGAGQAIISSWETAYKVNNLRRDPHAALCAFTDNFHGGGWVQVNGAAKLFRCLKLWKPWSICSVKFAASTKVGPNSTKECCAKNA